MNTAIWTLLAIETVALLALGGVFSAHGDWRFGMAQFLLAAVNLIVYSKGLS